MRMPIYIILVMVLAILMFKFTNNVAIVIATVVTIAFVTIITTVTTIATAVTVFVSVAGIIAISDITNINPIATVSDVNITIIIFALSSIIIFMLYKKKYLSIKHNI